MSNDKDDLAGKINEIKDGIKTLEKGQSTMQKKIDKRFGLTIIMISVAALIVVAMLYNSDYVVNNHEKPIHSQYIIENLKGDTVKTWNYWLLAGNETMHIRLVDSPESTDERRNVIYNAIMSDEIIELEKSLQDSGNEISKSTYYLGWSGALKSIAEKTKSPVPTKFDFKKSPTGEGEIVIELTKQRNGDGFSAFTKSIIDDENHQILKSSITIYEIDEISNDHLATVIRHEMGHALGLSHSTAPEDLMYPIIFESDEYISKCDIAAIKALYDGKQNSQVVCDE